jgi:hypothetical protein
LQGEGAPEDVHPHYLLRNGQRVNFTQCLPYTDQDVFNYEQLYINIQLSFKKEFEWIEAVVSLSCGFQILVLDVTFNSLSVVFLKSMMF